MSFNPDRAELVEDDAEMVETMSEFARRVTMLREQNEKLLDAATKRFTAIITDVTDKAVARLEKAAADAAKSSADAVAKQSDAVLRETRERLDGLLDATSQTDKFLRTRNWTPPAPVVVQHPTDLLPIVSGLEELKRSMSAPRSAPEPIAAAEKPAPAPVNRQPFSYKVKRDEYGRITEVHPMIEEPASI